jgi:hypothetical protein
MFVSYDDIRHSAGQPLRAITRLFVCRGRSCCLESKRSIKMGLLLKRFASIGSRATSPHPWRALLIIFNAANEKDAFAASLPEIQDVATIDVGAGGLPRRSQRRWFLDYVQPTDLLNDATKAALRKASLSVRDLLIRSFLAGGLLA